MHEHLNKSQNNALKYDSNALYALDWTCSKSKEHRQLPSICRESNQVQIVAAMPGIFGTITYAVNFYKDLAPYLYAPHLKVVTQSMVGNQVGAVPEPERIEGSRVFINPIPNITLLISPCFVVKWSQTSQLVTIQYRGQASTSEITISPSEDWREVIKRFL